MSREYWKEVLVTARKTLAELRVKRDELDAEREEVNLEIVQLEQVVSNLTPLVPDLPMQRQATFRLPSEIKLTDACREILKKYDQHMTPSEIRNALAEGGYDLSQHANALASIHGVLKRLTESGEAEALSHDVRGTMYRWKNQGTRYPTQSAGGTAPYPNVKIPVPTPRTSSVPTRYDAKWAELEAAEKKDLKK